MRSAPRATPAATRRSRSTCGRCGRRRSPEPVVRFETPPGHQAQVDFAEFRLPWGKRYALLVVLGYSRLLWLQFYARQTMAVLMRGLEEAFAFFGGVPAELLFDQMKAVIIEDERRDRRQAARERRVHALRRALGLPHPRLPAVSGQDQGQGRAADRLRAGELLLRPQLPQRRRSQCAGAVVAGADGQRPHPSDYRRGAARALRARRARAAASPWRCGRIDRWSWRPTPVPRPASRYPGVERRAPSAGVV